MFSPRLSAFVFAIAWTGSAWAQLQDDAPPNLKTTTTELKAFKELRAQKKAAFLNGVRQALLKPTMTPGAAGNFVIECMRQVQYVGKDGGNQEFSEWKKKNRLLFSDRDFERASALHLGYLSLTVWRATLDSAEPVQVEVWSYLEQLNAARDLIANVVRDPAQIRMNIFDPKEQKVTGQIIGDIENTQLASAANTRTFVQDMLNQGVDSGLVAQAYKLPGQLEGISDWEMSPGNFSGIMEKDVRPVLREHKDQRLLTTWDNEIAFTAGVVDLKPDKRAGEKFRREEYPRLIWKKAADAELLGLKNRALYLRLDIAKRYPSHPDFDTWEKKIETQLAELKKNDPKTAPEPDAPSGGTGFGVPAPQPPATPGGN